MSYPQAPDFDDIRWGGPDGLRVPLEAGKATFLVKKLSTIALGTIGTATTVALSPDQLAASEIIVTAAGAFAVTLTLSAAIPGKPYILYNNTANNVTMKVTGQTGITVATTKRALLVCESTDIARVTADT